MSVRLLLPGLILSFFACAGCGPNCEQGPIAYQQSRKTDSDFDGFCAGFDCDDSNPEINPGIETEVCDGIDNDCDPSTFPAGADSDIDSDGDGIFTCDTTPDCDDNDPTIAPGLEETCDGRDEDCNGDVDEGLGDTWYPDVDGDGFGNTDRPEQLCQPDDTFTQVIGDCDDTDPNVHPAAEDICNDVDDDCDELIDPGPGWPRLSVGTATTSLPMLQELVNSEDHRYLRHYTHFIAPDSLPFPSILRLGDSADLDGDGRTDLVLHRQPTNPAVSWGSALHLSHTPGGQAETFVFPGKLFIVPDMDSDGHPELLFGDPETDDWTLLLDSSPSELVQYSSAGSQARVMDPGIGVSYGPLGGEPSVFLDDLNGDGDPEWVLTPLPDTTNEQLLVSFGLDAPRTVRSLGQQQLLRRQNGGVDFDGDGVLDLLGQSTFDHFTIAYGSGLIDLASLEESSPTIEQAIRDTPSAGCIIDLSSVESSLSHTVGDFDSDGHLDIAFSFVFSRTVGVVWGDTLLPLCQSLDRPVDLATDGAGALVSLIDVSRPDLFGPADLWTIPAPSSCGDQPDGLALRDTRLDDLHDVLLIFERLDLDRESIRPLAEQSPIAFSYEPTRDTAAGISPFDSLGNARGDSLPDFLMIPDAEAYDIFILHDLRAPDPLD